MRLIDEPQTPDPPYGSRQMSRHLRWEGCAAAQDRLRHSVRNMGLEAICCKPLRSQPRPGQKAKPCLLRHVSIKQPHLWLRRERCRTPRKHAQPFG